MQAKYFDPKPIMPIVILLSADSRLANMVRRQLITSGGNVVLMNVGTGALAGA